MDVQRLEVEYAHLELATDTAVQLTEMEWRASGLSDEDRAPEYAMMFRELRALNERSLREPLQYTDPKALFDMVCYAKHIGMWRGYRHNQGRLRYVDPDEPITWGSSGERKLREQIPLHHHNDRQHKYWRESY